MNRILETERLILREMTPDGFDAPAKTDFAASEGDFS